MRKSPTRSFRRTAGKSLREWRLKSGLTREQMGLVLEVTGSTVSNLETGHVLLSIYGLAIAARRIDMGIGELAEILYGEATRQMKNEEFEQIPNEYDTEN